MIGARPGCNSAPCARLIRHRDNLTLLLSRLVLLEVRRLSRAYVGVGGYCLCSRGFHCGEGACGEKYRGGATRDGPAANPKVIESPRV